MGPLQFAGAVILLEPQSRFTYANAVWICPNWVIVHANRWLNRQLPNLHEWREVVHIQKQGAPEHYASRRLSSKPVKTWPLELQSCINPRASQGVKLHKWNLPFDLGCRGNHRNSDKVIFRKYHGRGWFFSFSFRILDLKQKFKLSILLWLVVRNEF